MTLRKLLTAVRCYVFHATPVGASLGAIVGGFGGAAISDGDGELLCGCVGGMVAGGVAGGAATLALPFAPLAAVYWTATAD